MAYGKVESVVMGYAQEAASLLGFEVVDVEYVKEGGRWILRIYIDKDGGISTDDCEKMSRSVEKILDENDPIENSYSLEVSSPGLDRPLKKETDFEKFKGKKVDIKLYKAKKGAKKYHGELLGLDGGIISIIDENGEMQTFDRKETASVKLAVVFE